MPRRNILKPPTKITPDLAYFIASIMGDGCISYKPSKKDYTTIFGSIDLEYCKLIRKIIRNHIQFNKTTPTIRKRKEKTKRKQYYIINIYSKDLCKWLIDITKQTIHIPQKILNGTSLIKKSFLMGIMDSEGSISKQKRKYGFHYAMSLRLKDTWIKEIYNLFQEIGVATSPNIKKQKMTTKINGKKYKTYQYYFYINILSYIGSDLTFIIQRKRKKLAEYLKKTKFKFASYSLLSQKEKNKFLEKIGKKRTLNSQIEPLIKKP